VAQQNKGTRKRSGIKQPVENIKRSRNQSSDTDCDEGDRMIKEQVNNAHK